MKSSEEKEAVRTGTSAMAGEDKPKAKKKGKVIGFNLRKAQGKGHRYTIHNVHEHPEVPGAEQVDSVPHALMGRPEIQQHMDEHMPEEAEEAGAGGEPGAPA